MANVVTLPGFNDLGCWVTPIFLSRNRFYLQSSPHFSKMNEKSKLKLKKIQDFCPQDIEFCHLAAARHVKPRSLNDKLYLNELHQLTKFTYSNVST